MQYVSRADGSIADCFREINNTLFVSNMLDYDDYANLINTRKPKVLIKEIVFNEESILDWENMNQEYKCVFVSKITDYPNNRWDAEVYSRH